MVLKLCQGSHLNKRKITTSNVYRKDVIWRHYDVIFPVPGCRKNRRFCPAKYKIENIKLSIQNLFFLILLKTPKILKIDYYS